MRRGTGTDRTAISMQCPLLVDSRLLARDPSQLDKREGSRVRDIPGRQFYPLTIAIKGSLPSRNRRAAELKTYDCASTRVDFACIRQSNCIGDCR